MIPHIVRLVVGGDYRRVLIGSAIAGAIFLLWADIVARTIMAPEDLPIGIVTGIIGGIFFVWLLRRNSIPINCKYCIYSSFKSHNKPKNFNTDLNFQNQR